MAWRENGWLLAGAAVVFPPLGLLFVWLSRTRTVWRKLLWTVPVVLLGVAHLFLFWGMRLQSDGTGVPRFATFERPEKHYQAIEKRVVEEREVEPAPTPEPVPAAPAPWPSYLGANRDAHYASGPILTAWPEKGLTQLWRRPIGGGYPSMIVAEGKVFTIEQRRDQEVLAAYDMASGREVWTVAWKGFFQESMGGDGPRATPTYDEGRVYALGAQGEFRCVQASNGKVLWSKNILSENGASNLQWGMASSPLVVDDQVVVLPGGSSGNSVVSYDKRTGATKWRALDDKAAYTAPMIATLAGERQVVVVTAARAVGLTLGGKLLWEFPWKTDYDVNAAQPVVAGPDGLVLAAGYDHGTALVEISRDGDKFAARQVWFSKSMKAKFNTPVVKDGVLYGLDEGIFAAVDVATGQRKWKGGRYGYGQVLLAGDHLVILTEAGEVVLVKTNPDRLEEIARFEALSGKTWNPPAIADGKLLVRNTTEMACYRIAP